MIPSWTQVCPPTEASKNKFKTSNVLFIETVFPHCAIGILLHHAGFEVVSILRDGASCSVNSWLAIWNTSHNNNNNKEKPVPLLWSHPEHKSMKLRKKKTDDSCVKFFFIETQRWETVVYVVLCLWLHGLVWFLANEAIKPGKLEHDFSHASSCSMR